MTDEKPRGRARSEARTAEMLWAAAQLFARQGVGATTTRQVAELAQTTERTLFKHFGTKDALVRAVIDEAVLAHLAPTSLAALTQAIEAYEGDLAAWHRALLATRLEALAAAPELTRLLVVEVLRDEALRNRFASQWRPAVWQPLVELFGSLQAQRKLRRDLAPEQLARQFLSLNLGFLLARLLLAPGLPWDDGAEMQAVAALFEQGGEPAQPSR